MQFVLLQKLRALFIWQKLDNFLYKQILTNHFGVVVVQKSYFQRQK